MSTNTIFVQIASYRDPDCRNTIRSLYETAKYPMLISVGVVWQCHPDDKFQAIYEDQQWAENIAVKKVNSLESKGVCWARSLCQALHTDENFTLQIDSHMRFVKHWDDELLSTLSKLEETGYSKPIISHYPPAFIPNGKYDTRLGKMAVHFRDDGIPIFKLSGYSIIQNNSDALPSASVAGGFLFARSNIIYEVPYDPHIYFMGEEITLSIRLWTNGWDIFYPRKIVAYHLYKSSIDNGTGNRVKNREIETHHKDNAKRIEFDIKSIRRVRHLLGIQLTDDSAALTDISTYDFGDKRTLYQYEQYAGINLKQASRDHYARLGLYFNVKNHAALEAVTLVKNLETECQDNLCRVIQHLNIDSVLEIGVNQRVTLINSLKENIRYTGMANSKSDSEKLNIQHRHTARSLFINHCAFTQPVPDANCIVVNIDFSTTDISDVWSLLDNLYWSKSDYLVFAHTDTEPALLKQSPFNFPDELLSCKGDATTYSMWLTKDLKSFLQPCDSSTSQLRQHIVQVINSYLSPLEQLYKNDPDSYYQLLLLLHSEMKSEKARNFYEDWSKKYCIGATVAAESFALKNLIRLRFWSNEARLLAEFSFLNKKDKDKVIAMSSEHLHNYSNFILAID